MKKHLAAFAASFFMLAVIPAHAQYGQYDAPSQQQQPPRGSYPSAAAPPYGTDQSGQGSYQGPTQGPDQTADQGNDPQPGIARLSFIRGDVSSQRGDTGDWVAATLNTPVAVGDRVSTGPNSRAEVQLDSANVLRMADGSTAKIAVLNRGNIQVQIGQGLVTFAVLRGAEASAEIDTPNAAIHPLGPGDYRILVGSDAETQVIVRSGAVEISEPQGTTRVEQGQSITIAGTDNPQYRTDAAVANDEWDTWNAGRDQRITTAQSWQKTDRYYTGSEDLDNNGTWSEVPDYGPVWTPSNVDPDWAPYRDGRWVYEPYYGWTWVGSEPWGWAPYHYGRWFVNGGRWGWWPGPVGGYGYYPVWSPAYVSFFGFGGGGFGIGFGGGFGRVGWLPCGPGDWYHPWYGRWGGRYNAVGFDRVNGIHEGFGPLAGNRRGAFSNFNEAARNDRVRNGFSSMEGNQFGRGAVPRNQERVSEASFRQASLMTGRMPITPSRESFSPSGRAANPSSFRNAPPSSQRFFNAGGSRSFANTNAGSRGQSAFGANESGRNSGSFGRTGNSASVQSNRPGWQTFTPPQSSGANRSAQGFPQGSRAETNSSGRNSERGAFQGGSSIARSSNGQPQSEGRNGWQHFTPPSNQSRTESQVQSQSQGSSRGFPQQGEPQRGYAQSPSVSRGSSSNSYYRSPLNMSQPIVTPRGESSVSGNSGRSYNQQQPAYNQPRGGYSQPSYSQPRTYSAPAPAARSYNAPAPRSNYSAPRSTGGGNGNSRGGGGSGGNSHGGGGGHSGERR